MKTIYFVDLELFADWLQFVCTRCNPTKGQWVTSAVSQYDQTKNDKKNGIIIFIWPTYLHTSMLSI